MTGPFSPAERGSLKDMVLPAIRDAILTGEIPAGTRLSDAEIARSMQVSRAPVREAFAHLEQEGLVMRRPNRGTFVAEIFTNQDVVELTGLRSALEGYAISLVVAQITSQELALLSDLVDRMIHAADCRDLARLADLDFQFHRTICQAARHRRLLQVWSTIASQYWALYLTSLQYVDTDISRVGQHHRPIIDALRASDVDAAVALLQENIMSSGDQLRTRLPDEASDMSEESRGSSSERIVASVSA